MSMIVVALILLEGAGGFKEVKVGKNIIFRKLNKKMTTTSMWQVVFLINLKNYQELTSKLNISFETAQRAITFTKDRVNKVYRRQSDWYADEVRRLGDVEFELTTLRESRLRLANQIEVFHKNQLNSRTLSQDRKKRGWNLFGDILDIFGFGSRVNREDVQIIKDNIQTLSSNQQTLMHTVGRGLTILNVTRGEVQENRIKINNIQGILNEAVARIEEIYARQNNQITFNFAYAALRSIMYRLRTIVDEAAAVFVNLKLKIDFLLAGQLNPTVIDTNQLRTILQDIRDRLPKGLALPFDPEGNVLEFYKLLTCSAKLFQEQLVVLISIPLIDVSATTHVYKAIPLPVSFTHNESNKPSNVMALYALETDTIAVNSANTEYTLLSHESAHRCLKMEDYCDLSGEATYPIAGSTACVISLFLNEMDKSDEKCDRVVTSKIALPRAYFIKPGLWLVVTNERLSFSILCREAGHQTSRSLIIDPPKGIIALEQSCSAVSKAVRLPPFFRSPRQYSDRDTWTRDLDKFEINKEAMWAPIKTHLPKINVSLISRELENVKNVGMGALIKKLRLQSLKSYTEPRLGWWFYVIVALGVVVVVGAMLLYRERIGRLLQTDRSGGITKAIIENLKDDNEDPGPSDAGLEAYTVKPNLSLSVN